MDNPTPIGLSVPREAVPVSLLGAMDELEKAQRDGDITRTGAGPLARFELEPRAMLLLDVGHRDTESSAAMAIFILIAVFSGLYGIGGLVSGSWAVWLLPVCALSIVIAWVKGKRWGREEAATRAGGVERDGTYLLPGGVVTRSHDRYKYWPLETILHFRHHTSTRGAGSTLLVFESGGVRQVYHIASNRDVTEHMARWLQAARAGRQHG